MTGTCFDSQLASAMRSITARLCAGAPRPARLLDRPIRVELAVQRPVRLQPAEADFGNCDGDDVTLPSATTCCPSCCASRSPPVRDRAPGSHHLRQPQQWCAPHRAVQRQGDDGDASAMAGCSGRICIATDPVRENNQTNNLPYSETKKDASRYGVGMPVSAAVPATAHAE